MFKKTFAFLLTLFCISLASIGFFYAQRQPTLFLSHDADLSEPTRYAFLTESNRPSSLVVDIPNKITIGRLALPAIAEQSGIDNISDSLIISNHSTLFVQNLLNGKRSHKTLNTPIDTLATYKQTLALRSKTEFYLYHLPDLALIKQEKFSGESISLHYAELTKSWISLENPPAIILFDTQAQRFPLPYQHISAAALSPDNRLLAFSAITETGQNVAVIWSLEEKKILQTYPLKALSLRPLIDNNSKFIYFIDNAGNGLQFSSANISATPRHFSTLNHPNAMALGFLETRLIVRNENTISIIGSDNLETLAIFTLPETGKGIFMSADSKTALIGGKQQLFILQLLHHELNAIQLPEIIQPNKIFMGASNTLCH